jgi:hypothetical protein
MPSCQALPLDHVVAKILLPLWFILWRHIMAQSSDFANPRVSSACPTELQRCHELFAHSIDRNQ